MHIDIGLQVIALFLLYVEEWRTTKNISWRMARPSSKYRASVRQDIILLVWQAEPTRSATSVRNEICYHALVFRCRRKKSGLPEISKRTYVSDCTRHVRTRAHIYVYIYKVLIIIKGLHQPLIFTSINIIAT